MIEQRKYTYKPGISSGVLEGQVIPAAIMTPVMLLLSDTNIMYTMYAILAYLYSQTLFNRWYQTEKQKYHTVGTISKSTIKIVERGKIDPQSIQILDSSHSWRRTGT